VAASRLQRLGILCAWLYVVVFIGSQVILSFAEQITLDPKQSVALREQAVLRYWHVHTGLIIFGSAAAVIGFLLLVGVAWAIYEALGTQRPTLARLALVVGLAGIVLSALAAIVQGIELASLADRLVHASTAAARTTVIQEYDNAPTPFVVLYLLGIESVAAWLGLVGVTLLQSHGRSSVAGWASLAACLLEGIGLPVLVAWVLGAAIGLWRLSGSESVWIRRLGLGRLLQLAPSQATPTPAERDETPAQSGRLVAAQGSKARAGQTGSVGEVAGGSGLAPGARTGAARRPRRKR
jgi:hypothetical protein